MWFIFKLFLLIHNSENTQCLGLSRSLYLQKLSHQKLLMDDSGDLLSIDENVEAVKCMEKCMSLLKCTAFNYDVVNKVCEFIPEQNQPISLTSAQNSEFYRVLKTVTQKGNAYVCISPACVAGGGMHGGGMCGWGCA